MYVWTQLVFFRGIIICVIIVSNCHSISWLRCFFMNLPIHFWFVCNLHKCAMFTIQIIPLYPKSQQFTQPLFIITKIFCALITMFIMHHFVLTDKYCQRSWSVCKFNSLWTSVGINCRSLIIILITMYCGTFVEKIQQHDAVGSSTGM